MEYEWERYSDAEEWCDDFLRLIREMQANYEYKRNIMATEIWQPQGWMPGKDLDEYGSRIMEHLANRPVVIFNLIGEREEGEEGISDRVGEISLYCGTLADENLRKMGDNAPAQMDEIKPDMFDACESLIDEIMDLRNDQLKSDFKEKD